MKSNDFDEAIEALKNREGMKSTNRIGLWKFGMKKQYGIEGL